MKCSDNIIRVWKMDIGIQGILNDVVLSRQKNLSDSPVSGSAFVWASPAHFSTYIPTKERNKPLLLRILFCCWDGLRNAKAKSSLLFTRRQQKNNLQEFFPSYHFFTHIALFNLTVTNRENNQLNFLSCILTAHCFITVRTYYRFTL